MSCRREAMNRYISASGSIWRPLYSRRSRICSLSSVPPGSRTRTGSRLASHSVSSSAWVVLPEPSVPSNVMKSPRFAISAGSVLGRLLGRSRNAQPALRFLAGAPSGKFVLSHQLVLQPAEIGVLRGDLDRSQGRLHLPDRRRRLGERPRGGLVLLFDAVDPRERVAHLADRVALQDVDRQAAALRLAQAVRAAPVVVLERQHGPRAVKVAEHAHGQLQLADRLLDVVAA